MNQEGPAAGRPSARVEAAGGVVVRRRDGAREVLVVRRPKYGDWSLPKGKLDPGESHAEAALREVEEETGVRCRLLEEIGEARYRDRKGREKRVRYWSMEPLEDGSAGRPPDAEIDRVEWVAAERAARILTYPRDRELVGDALDL